MQPRHYVLSTHPIKGKKMSRKYPDQCATKNIRVNQLRLRERHNQAYAYAHERREMEERVQAKLEEFRARDPEGYTRRKQAQEAREAEERSKGSSVPPKAVSPRVSGTVLAGAGSTALGGAAVLLASGAGTAFVLNKTVLKDDPEAPEPERAARKAGRAGTYAGGLAGAGATAVTIGAAGTVSGLSSAGIAAGLASVGASVGGGVAAGAALAVAAPAALAVATGYGVYRLVRAIKERVPSSGGAPVLAATRTG
jgi:hypothetical protein